MKNILITGAGSYIGTAVAHHLAKFPDRYRVTTLDMVDGAWRDHDFSAYHTVYHVAGIAHSDVGHVTEEQKAFYYKINRDLTLETAQKAKAEGVSQFIFMSSAIVYGDSAPIGRDKHITAQTEPAPANFYGDSKLQAEKAILPLQDDIFRVVILRPPMIYGKGSRGNYPTLSKLARKLPIFPRVRNRRSMLYIGNLAEFVRLMIENQESGIFCPQNKEFSDTCTLMQLIAQAHGKKLRLIPGFTWALKLMSHCTGLVNKAFGSLSYDQAFSAYKQDYCLYTLEESIQLTEQ